MLFIDDDAAVVDSLGRLLELDGLHVESAADGESGLVLARGRWYDVILLDLRLPRMSGLEVLQQLRREGIWTPVLILTAFPSVDSAFDARGLGAVGYLTKSMITGAELASALRKAAATGKPRMLKIRPLFSPFRAERLECISALLEHLARMEQSLESAAGTAFTEVIRADLRRALDQRAPNRRLTFLEFVAVAKSMESLSLLHTSPLSVAVPKIREWIEDASDRSCSPLDPAVEQVLSAFEAAGRNWSMLAEADIAAGIGIEAYELWRLLVENLGLTFPKSRRAVVMRRAALELANTNEHVRQIAFLVGYKDEANLNRDFRHFFGITPTDLRRLL